MTRQTHTILRKEDLLYLHLLLFSCLAVFSAETVPGSIRIMVCTVFSLITMGLGIWTSFNQETRSELFRRLSLVGIGLCFISIFLPIRNGNPFHSLNLEAAGSAFITFLGWVSYSISFGSQTNQKSLNRFLFWLPLLFIASAQSYYIFLDFSEIQPTDHARHLGNLLVLYDQMVGGEGGKFFNSLLYYDFYQPFVYLTSLPFIALLGKSYTSACLSLVIIWLPLGYYYLWRICRNYWRLSASGSAFACLILLGSLLPTSMLKQYMQDFPILVLGVITWFQILQSGFFTDRHKSQLAGLFFGLGLLAKANFLLVGIGLCLVPLYRIYKKGNWEQGLYNMGTYFMIGFALLLTWLSINHSHYNFNLAGMRDFAGVQNLPPVNTIPSIIWYWVRLPGIWGWPVFVILIIGIFTIVREKRFQYSNYQTLAGFVFVVLAASTVRNKDLRSLLPLAVLALPLVYGIWKFPNLAVRNGLITILTFFTIAQNVYSATGFHRLLPSAICQDNYAIPVGPVVPFAHTPNQDWYVYRKLYTEHFSDSAAFSTGQATTLFTDRAYGSIFRPEPSVGKSILSKGRQVRFFKDHFWPDYFLFSFSGNPDSISIELLGKQARIKGDFMFQARFLDSTNKEISSSVINVLAGVNHFHLKPPALTKNVVYSFKSHHLHPEAQKEAAVFLLSRLDYSPMFVTLDCIKNGGRKIADDTLSLSQLYIP